MTELKQLIAGLIRGEQTFEVVSHALDEFLEQSPDAAAGVTRLLQAARDSGLPPHVFVALNAQVAEHATSVGDANATVFAAEALFDADALSSADALSLADTVSFADTGADATVFPADNEDPDATVFAGDSGDATMVLSDHDASGSRVDLDATVVTDDDADVTRIDAQEADQDSANYIATMVLDRPVELVDPRDDADSFDPSSGATTTGAASPSEYTSLTSGQAVDDRTIMSEEPDDGFDILSTTAMSAVESSTASPTGAPTGATRPTAVGQTSGSDGGPIAGVDREFQEGDLLRGRFELISKLGEGGMGAVWKGKDKLKEEARDRNPFVAIKLLQGDFKAHPEAFIALQRETAKQQRLAHPNIATVYDFDRDDATNTVFMTMEVLDGQPMDAFIRKLPADGLSEEEAMPMVEELCAGLSYAHQASLVHSDLKPGNCFYTREGNIKLLDFGIARASKTTDEAEGETTLFDPGSLGALTPTYATIEMFEGDDPDPRDDIYALAIMTYQLLTGKHPYGKKSALKAKELGLAVEPIAKLSKRQNKGLAHGLEFLRVDRTASVEEFLESVTRKKSRTGLWVGAGIAATIFIGVLSYNPVLNYINEGKREDVIALVQQGGAQNIGDGLAQAEALGEGQLALVLDDPRVINAAAELITANNGNSVEGGLEVLATYPADWQGKVKDVDAARTAIFGHYEQRIQASFSPADGHFDFPAAKNNLASLDALYPDSAQVFQLRSTLDDTKRETLTNLGDRYKELKAAGKLIPIKDEEDISDVLLAVKAINAEHFLLSDKDLPFRFAQEAEKAIKPANESERDLKRADALLVASAAYAPNDGKLKGLRYDLDQILTRIENEKRIAALEARLAQAESGLRALPDYQRVRDELVALADLSAQSKVLSRIQTRLKSTFSDAISSLIAARKWQQSEDLLFSFARLLSIADLTRQRAALSQAETTAGFTPDLAARKPQVDERVAAVQALLAKPEFSIDWETQLKVPYKELLALQPLGSPQLEEVRTETARLLLSAALEARKQENFNQAREFVAKGLEFYPGLKNFTDENAAINSAEQRFAAKRAEEERLAKVETLKSEFTERAGSNDIQSANATLQELRDLGVKADDVFLATTAPTQLADSYQRLSKSRADGEDYLQAAELAEQGLKLNPKLNELAKALAGYQIEIKKRERELQLVELFNSTKPIKVAEVQQSLAALKTDIPDRFDAVVKKISESRATQLRNYAKSKNVDIATLAARSKEFASLFPRAGASLADELANSVEPRLRKVNVRSPKALARVDKPLAAFAKLAPKRHAALSADLAAKTLSEIQRLETSDKRAASVLASAAKRVFSASKSPAGKSIAALKIVVPLPEVIKGLAQLQRGQLAAAAKNLAAAKAKDAAHPDVAAFASQLDERRKQADGLYAQHVAKAKDPLGYKAKDEIKGLYRKAASLCGDCGFKERQAPRPIAGLCHQGLAGFGAKRAGQCWDQLGRSKGPMMVVVPSGSEASAPFAIGKYEVSQRDFNLFCKASSQCKVVLGSKSRLPTTGVPAQLAEAYAKWLSAAASRTLKQKVVYRLPTATEWEYAAKAGGSQPNKKFNCRVTSGGNIIAGHDLVDARSGRQNGWGLANYVGNARELVRAGGGFAVRGGNFEVPLTKCDISISKPHPGSADATTGFRLVRELG